MKPKHYLVVGASSVAGQKAIEAIRAKDANAKITVTTSKADAGGSTALTDRVDENRLSSAVETTVFGVDLSKPESIRNIKPALSAPVDVLVFCPIFAEDKLKTKSSFRTLPLIPAMRARSCQGRVRGSAR